LTQHPDNDRRDPDKSRVQTQVFYASPFTVSGRLRSVRHAAVGFWFVLKSQHNAWLHAVATILAFLLAAILHFMGQPMGLGEWAVLVASIVLVWVSETFNTGLEVLAEAITKERHPILKIAKDVAAAAVLMSALGAVTVGGILFIPRLVTLFTHGG
jgi:diacylglycerol kinase (ATP)